MFRHTITLWCLSAFWERGSPDLPTCVLRRGSKGGPARPIFINTDPRPSRGGQASRGGRRGASSGTASPGWLARRRRDQGGVPHEVPVTQAIPTEGTRRVPACAVSSFPPLAQREQAQPQSTEASGRGCHFSATRPRPGGLQDRGHCGAQDGVTTRALCRRRPLLSGYLVLVVPLRISPPLLAPFLLNIWEEDQGLYK